MLNKPWHLAHVMPKNATLEQRVEWHRAHAQACDCREMPPSIAAEIKKRDLKPQSHAREKSGGEADRRDR